MNVFLQEICLPFTCCAIPTAFIHGIQKKTSKNSITWRQSRYSKNQIFNCLPRKIIFLPKNVEYMSPEYNINFNSTKIYMRIYTQYCALV